MGNVLIVRAERYAELSRHLHRGPEEQVAFVFASASEASGGVVFRSVEHYLCAPSDYDGQARYHVELTDEAQAQLIKMAWDRRVALVEFHSHPALDAPAEFSSYDLRGLAEFVPHVRWRLKGQPYAALVFGSHNFDALVWRSGGSYPEPLLHLEIGEERLFPTNRTITAPDLFARLKQTNGR